MNVVQFRDLLRTAPLIASVQASPESPVDDPSTLLKLAQASLNNGVRILRLEGVENIRRIKTITGAVVIGLIKKEYPGSKVYITPTVAEVDALLETGCEVIALDATLRDRPERAFLGDLIDRIHAAGRLVLADCDTLASASAALRLGADMVSTTLAGYTEATANVGSGPAMEILRQICAEVQAPVLAEGRFTVPREVRSAMCIGADGIVIGGALNDPVKQTNAFVRASRQVTQPVMAVDIGGTWLRAALFSPDWQLQKIEKVALPATRDDRFDWIRTRAEEWNIEHVGISSGGTIDPRTGVVTESKDIIPNHEGSNFSVALHRLKWSILNDGLATAWGHACLPQFAGRRVATIALGTGVGFGFVDRGQILMGPHGEYPRLNDVVLPGGQTIEEVLGGATLTIHPSEAQKEIAREVARVAVSFVQNAMMPDTVVLCGGVGLSDWLGLDVPTSPFGEHAGLYGAAALALFPWG